MESCAARAGLSGFPSLSENHFKKKREKKREREEKEKREKDGSLSFFFFFFLGIFQVSFPSSSSSINVLNRKKGGVRL